MSGYFVTMACSRAARPYISCHESRARAISLHSNRCAPHFPLCSSLFAFLSTVVRLSCGTLRTGTDYGYKPVILTSGLLKVASSDRRAYKVKITQPSTQKWKAEEREGERERQKREDVTQQIMCAASFGSRRRTRNGACSFLLVALAPLAVLIGILRARGVLSLGVVGSVTRVK